MKKISLLFLLSIIVFVAQAQTESSKDSLMTEMCKAIDFYKGLDDTLLIGHIVDEHLNPFLENLPEKKRQSVGQEIYFRLQKKCDAFAKILERLVPQKGDWERVSAQPAMVISTDSCKKFLSHKNYYYLESTGDTVRLSLANGFWTERFIDKTYSKLSFKWTGDCSFEISFISSSNLIRKNYSKPGDIYKYQIIEQTGKYFFMSTNVEASTDFMTFKIYYE